MEALDINEVVASSTDNYKLFAVNISPVTCTAEIQPQKKIN